MRILGVTCLRRDGTARLRGVSFRSVAIQRSSKRLDTSHRLQPATLENAEPGRQRGGAPLTLRSVNLLAKNLAPWHDGPVLPDKVGECRTITKRLRATFFSGGIGSNNVCIGQTVLKFHSCQELVDEPSGETISDKLWAQIADELPKVSARPLASSSRSKTSSFGRP